MPKKPSVKISAQLPTSLIERNRPKLKPITTQVHFDSESSDGVINLSSQLRMEAQEQASQVRGYDEDHVSILTNESVIAQVNQILDANSQKK